MSHAVLSPDPIAAAEARFAALTKTGPVELSPAQLSARPSVLPVAAANTVARKPWIHSPAFDLFFVANLFWPGFLLIGLLQSKTVDESLGFWMVYMLITPHRWITLGLVFLDKERYVEKRGLFMGIAVVSAAFIVLNVLTLSTLTFLLVFDYMWNAWHFAAQHSGIGRIYGRIADPTDTRNPFWEKFALRVFCVYVILRLGAPLMAMDRSIYLGWLDAAIPYMTYFDLPMLAFPLWLLLREVPRYTPAALGRMTYLGSVCVLYGALLLLAHSHVPGTSVTPITAGLLTAVTVFHSTEYLAIVTWSVKKRHGPRQDGVLPALAKRWGVSLACFMLGLGVGAWMLDSNYQKEWVMVNMFVSFLHYAYDGIIWKARPAAKPRSAIDV